MTWKEKHDIILNWIDSCTTFAQLQNIIPFVKAQKFDNSSLLCMIRIKSSQIMVGVYADTIKKLAKPFAK